MEGHVWPISYCDGPTALLVRAGGIGGASGGWIGSEPTHPSVEPKSKASLEIANLEIANLEIANLEIANLGNA
jgi:hypothetical protein